MPPRALVGDPSAADPLHAALLRVAAGDGVSCTHLYDLTVASVHRLALMMAGGDHDTAADVVCAAYRAVFSAAPGWEATSLQPLSWVLSVARDAGAQVTGRAA